MPQGLGGKVALITGAAQGIGLGIAKRLAQDGVHLAFVDRSAEKLAQAQQQLSEYGVQVTHYVADVSDLNQVQQAIEHTETTLGGFDIMIDYVPDNSKRIDLYFKLPNYGSFGICGKYVNQ
jgi:meso-butanediol dehydrogenase / (S,S)-butanediol dehydrogenase / diacetyl reductase